MYQAQTRPAPQVMFYIMPEQSDPLTKPDVALNCQDYHLQACLQAAFYYRQKQRVFVFTDNQDSSHIIDELLWSFDPESFVPHNLIGEGPKGGAPVEIGHSPSRSRRPVLINLASQVPNFAGNYQTIIDFVPSDEALKQLARDRFRHYKQLGFIVETQQASEINTHAQPV